MGCRQTQTAVNIAKKTPTVNQRSSDKRLPVRPPASTGHVLISELWAAIVLEAISWFHMNYCQYQDGGAMLWMDVRFCRGDIMLITVLCGRQALWDILQN